MAYKLRFLVLVWLFFVGSAWAQAAAYDPLQLTGTVEVIDLSVHDVGRQREIPLRLYLPAPVVGHSVAAPLLLFSHGLGGSRQGYAYLGQHWAGRGYIAIFMQHAGSDAAVWQDLPPSQRMAALRAAASAKSFFARVKDVPAVLDALTRWNRQVDHPLFARLDLTRVGMSGHSFGAVTTQAVSGQAFFGARQPFAEPRIKAAVVMSPSAPQRGAADAAFSGVRRPWLLLTGTRDLSPIGNIDLASRLAVFPALPVGGKYELVLDGAEHSAFGDRALPGENGVAPDRYHRRILALSTAFWDAYLLENPLARAWLDGAGPCAVLASADRWQFK